MPCAAANSRCFFSSCNATSSNPSFTRSGVIASGRKVRWSRNIRMVPGSLTLASLPTSCSKKIAAIGVTYSWLKRMSVKTNPSSPGFTAPTPILPFAVDTLDALRDDKLYPRAHLRVRRLLARGALAPALAAHGGHEATALHGAAGNREFVAALEAEVREFAQRFVVVVADVRRGDFVGRDVVAQLVGWRPDGIMAGELRAHEAGILGQVKNPALQANICVAHARSIFLEPHVRNRVVAPASDFPKPAPPRELRRRGEPCLSGCLVDAQRFRRRSLSVRHGLARRRPRRVARARRAGDRLGRHRPGPLPAAIPVATAAATVRRDLHLSRRYGRQPRGAAVRNGVCDPRAGATGGPWRHARDEQGAGRAARAVPGRRT